MLDVRRLQIFSAVAEHGSFTAAAEALFMTHSAVSQQMALLERQLGLPLMIRGPRGVELTEAGRVLAERSTVLLGSIASIEHEMRDLTARHACVRLAAFPTAGADLIPRVVRDYQKRFPDVRVELRSVHTGDIAACLREGTVHLGLVWDYDFAPRTFGPDIERIPLTDDPLCALFPLDHPLAGEPAVDLADLSGETWVVRAHRPPYDDAFVTMCRLAGFEPHIGFVTEDYQSAQGLVAAGIGISAVPLLSLVARHPEVVAVPIAPPTPCRRIAAVRLRGAGHPQAAQQMLEVLRDGTAVRDTP
ncbi:MAG: DNA-binding transcriptional regulator, LysR family [Actinoallomurus sp.]|jgi:DNA-binding transcriptional LysR family regulator|nr:DNA-binding transcriptional regulator, LysR family [Actinoallomurus sp.]